TGPDRGDRQDLLARIAALRLHGRAQRAEGVGYCPQARLALRHHVDVVLPVAARPQAGPEIAHAALAGPAVPRLGPFCPRRHRLLPDPDRPRGGGRHPGDDLTSLANDQRSASTWIASLSCVSLSGAGMYLKAIASAMMPSRPAMRVGSMFRRVMNSGARLAIDSGRPDHAA